MLAITVFLMYPRTLIILQTHILKGLPYVSYIPYIVTSERANA